MARLYLTHAAIALIPVLVLGAALYASYERDSNRQDKAEAQAAGKLIAQTAVEPLLDPAHHPGQPFTPAELAALQALQRRAVDNSPEARRSPDNPAVLSMEVKDLAGQPVVTRDASAPSTSSDGRAVTVLVPIEAGDPKTRVGTLEVTLVEAPSNTDLTSFARDLAVGLGALYLALFAISLSISRGLRKEVALNAFLAEHDNLTDLPNRTLFHRRAEAAIKVAHGERQTAVAIIDLDRFKDVNDTLGHHNGDRLLSELARRLDINTRPEDTVARLGGDEFGVVLSNVADAEDALWRLRSVIDREVEVSGLPLSVESSIGFVVAPDDGTDVDDLLQRADVAMYVAKGKHAGVVRYDPDQDEYDATKLSLVAQLRHAIQAGQLVLHYQPKAALSDGRVEAVEALVRWEHPTRGTLYPDSFIPIAEQTDIIDKLTDWALATALADVKEMGGPRSRLAVAVNVSARSLSRPDFARRVESALLVAGVSPTRLIIEITETALVADPERAGAALAQLDAAGVRVSIDDFGKGQTSLGYLSALPVHELKIDMSFIRDMLDNPAHAAIVRSIIDLGHNLEQRVIAEGVETDAVLVALREAGCDVVQGFLLGRPMPLDDLQRWMKKRGTGGAARLRRPLIAKRRVPVP